MRELCLQVEVWDQFNRHRAANPASLLNNTVEKHIAAAGAASPVESVSEAEPTVSPTLQLDQVALVDTSAPTSTPLAPAATIQVPSIEPAIQESTESTGISPVALPLTGQAGVRSSVLRHRRGRSDPGIRGNCGACGTDHSSSGTPTGRGGFINPQRLAGNNMTLLGNVLRMKGTPMGMIMTLVLGLVIGQLIKGYPTV